MSIFLRVMRRINYTFCEVIIIIRDLLTPHRYLFKLYVDRILYNPTVYSNHSLVRTFFRSYKAFSRAFDYCETSYVKGDILEFGVFTGCTARVLAIIMRERERESMLLLFDSFEGLPEIISDIDKNAYHIKYDKIWAKGTMNLSKGIEKSIFKTLSRIIQPHRIKIIKGFYKNTLKNNLKNVKAKFVHIDCDLYESAIVVLEELIKNHTLQDGTVLLFDDYNTNRVNPDMGERKAITDIQKRYHHINFEPFFNYGNCGQAFFVHMKI